MAHEVEQMVYFGEVPWHGLGNLMPDTARYDIDECIKLAGLDFTVDTCPLYMADGREVSHRAVVREKDNAVYGVVGPQYTPLQNQDAFDWFQPFLDTKACQLHTAGSLFDGKKIWVLAQINSENSVIVKDDEIAKFILLSNSHDGTTSVRVGFTPIRVVCANTMAFAHGHKDSSLIRLRHCVNVKTNLENIREIMDVANLQFEATAEQFRLLASKNINAADLDKYVRKTLDIKEGEISTRSQNILEGVFARFTMGHQDMPGVRGTYWAAYNAVNEYLNYVHGRNVDNRMNNLWFGPNATTNDKALENALQMVS